MLNYVLANESETLAMGAKLAASCPNECIIFLKGELGAGKTTFVRGFIHSLGHKGTVKSPTYNLVEPYQLANKTIYHFDLYRLNNPEELNFIGIRDYVNASILLIEWPERAFLLLPSPDLTCYIETLDSGRHIQLSANSKCGQKILQKLSP